MCDARAVKHQGPETDSKVMAGGATTEETPDGRCSHCQRAVRADLGVENSAGDVLCGACFQVLGGRAPRRTASRDRLDALKRVSTL